MFDQLTTPVGKSLALSVLIAALPVFTVVVSLGVFRRPAWQAALAGLVVGIVVAIGVWQMPLALAAQSV
jgi:lactate permease